MFRLVAFSAIVSAVALAPVSAFLTPSANIGIAQYLTEYPMAKSLDGTPGFYYIRKATSSVNSSKWIMHIQGGGWCHTLASCKSRSETNLGSSSHSKTHEQDTQDLNSVHGCENNRWCGALMVNDPSINPVAHDWNAVLLRYTDGASWIGDLAEPVEHDGVKLYFRGRYNLEGVFDDLSAKHGLADATQVLIGGDSAGGLATFLHIDKMKDMIHDSNLKAGNAWAQVLGMPDSGFWPDDINQGFSDDFRNMFKMQTNGTSDVAGLPKHCQDRAANVTRCLFPQYFADQIETRLWPIQSLYDPLQKGTDPEAHGQWLLENLNRTVFQKNLAEGVGPNGGWIHSCERHCGAELLEIGGTQAPEAVFQFLSPDSRGDQTLWLQEKPYPCTDCCNDARVITV